MQRVAIYCRLSTEDKVVQEESESIQNQRLLLCDYAKKKGWEIYAVYADEDYSGLTEDRPAFQEMLKAAKEGHFSIVLCKTQSRFTRNMETAEKYLHHAFLLWGIRFVSVVDHVDTALSGSKKLRQINGLINEWYSEEISENIRAVLRRKQELGQFLGNYAPYGYQKAPEDRHRLLVDTEVAWVVAQIFQWYATEKLSCRKIAKRLTHMGIETPWQRKLARGEDTGRKNVAHPGVWSENTVRRILSNRVYIGDMVQGREQKLSFKERKVRMLPQEEWVIAEKTHEPIVPLELFSLAENRRKGISSSAVR